MSTLKGEVALVTGSSRGIGEAIVIELARRGAASAEAPQRVLPSQGFLLGRRELIVDVAGGAVMT